MHTFVKMSQKLFYIPFNHNYSTILDHLIRYCLIPHDVSGSIFGMFSLRRLFLFLNVNNAVICKHASTCAHHRSDHVVLVGVQHRRQLRKLALSAFALGFLDFHGHVDGNPVQLVLDVFLQHATLCCTKSDS